MAFTSQITGSPFTTPTNNISGIAYVNHGGSPAVKRIYYTADTDFTKIFCMSLTGSADTSREITLNNQGEAQVYPGRGLCTDGTYLFALVGTLGAQYIHTYRLSDRTYVRTYTLGYSANDRARAIEIFTVPGGTTQRLVVLRNNQVASYAVTNGTIGLATTDAHFGFHTNLRVTSGNWQGMAWDDTTNRLLINAETLFPTGAEVSNLVDKVFGFTYQGVRDDRGDFLPGIDVDDMTYNGDDDNLYMVHETSTNLYAWGDFPKWTVPDNFIYDIHAGTTFTSNLQGLVDNAAVISARNDYSSRTGLQDASLTNGVFTWTNPPEPANNAATQTVNLTFRATLGSHVTDHHFPFVLHRSVAPVVVAPQFQRTPVSKQVVYEPYTPPMGARNPPLSHGFTMNLSDLVVAGTPPFTFTAVRGGGLTGTFSITNRFVNGRPVHDALVYNSAAVTQSIENGFIRVTVSNAGDHTDTINIPVEVINLVYPAFRGATSFDISDTSSHSYNIREDYLDAEPQADIEFVGTPPSNLNPLLTNGILAVRANALGTDAPYSETITVKATNILTDTDGVQRTYTYNVAQHVEPDSAPVFIPGPVVIMTNRGQEGTYDLNRIIQSANPQPTFAVSAGSGILGTIQGRIDQHSLRYTIPDTITRDTDYPVDITATNRVDAAVETITVRGIYVAAPVFLDIPAQNVHTGQRFILDLNNYITGTPTPTITLNPTTGPQATATLTAGVFTWTVPDTFLRSETVNFGFHAVNPEGTADLTLPVGVMIDPEAIVITVADYEEIRKLIDTRLTKTELPDIVIGADAFVGAAIAWGMDRMRRTADILRDYPRSPAQINARRRSVIYRTAGIIAASVRQGTDPREIGTDITETILATLLFERAEEQAIIANEGIPFDLLQIAVPRQDISTEGVADILGVEHVFLVISADG